MQWMGKGRKGGWHSAVFIHNGHVKAEFAAECLRHACIIESPITQHADGGTLTHIQSIPLLLCVCVYVCQLKIKVDTVRRSN